MRGGRAGIVAAVLAGSAIIWVANLAGWWWITPLAGLVSGLLRPGRGGAGAAGLAGALGWGCPLAWQALVLGLPVGAVAGALVGLVGLGPLFGGLMIVATILLGLGLGASAAWLGGAVRGLLMPPPTRRRSI